MNKDQYTLFKLTPKHIPAILDVLTNGSKPKTKDIKAIQSYFKQKWIGYGCISNKLFLLGYCFIKHPKTRPETLTVTRAIYRNTGIATTLRNYALAQRKFKGHVVYSATKLDNPSSLKSLLKSGYIVFDVTKDGYIQLVKILPYA